MSEDLPAAPAKKKSGRKTGNGPGLWGEAKGFEYKPPQAFEAGNKYGAVPADPERVAARRQRAWDMECMLEELAYTAEFEQTRLAAAVKLHAIADGLPIARTEITGRDGAGVEILRRVIVDPGKKE